jgi:hypothetical protein
VVMRKQQAGQDERAGEPADEEVHFHGMTGGLDSTKTAGSQRSHDHAE